MPVEWQGDGTFAESLRVERNLVGLLHDVIEAAPNRAEPTIAMAREWHRRMFDGVRVPVPYFLGGIRDSDPNEPELIDYEVAVRGPVGVAPAVPAAEVPRALRVLLSQLKLEVAQLDVRYPYAGSAMQGGPAESVIVLCAWIHGEWIRIHPFVNGNGRTARIWANWVALRYGFPPFVRLRPRPEGAGYGSAAERSMSGDHRYMEIEMWRMLASYLEVGKSA